mgnify:CR=1 FL=1
MIWAGNGIEMVSVNLLAACGPAPCQLGVARIAFAQDLIGDGHFTDVVQDGTAADVFHVSGGNADGLRQLQGQLGDAAAVTFRFFVAQFERVRPSLQGRVVGLGQFLGPRLDAAFEFPELRARN